MSAKIHSLEAQASESGRASELQVD